MRWSLAPPPNSDFALSSTGKADITASVEQSKTEFTYADGVRIGQSVKATGTVTAHDMTAGKWHGQYEFNVNLSKAASQTPEHPASQPVVMINLDGTFNSDLTNITVDGVELEMDTSQEQMMSYLQQGKNVSNGITDPTVLLFEKDGGSVVEFRCANGDSFSISTNNIPETIDDDTLAWHGTVHTMRWNSLEELLQQMGG